MKFRRELFLTALIALTGYLAIVEKIADAQTAIITATSLALGVYFGYRIAEKTTAS